MMKAVLGDFDRVLKKVGGMRLCYKGPRCSAKMGGKENFGQRLSRKRSSMSSIRESGTPWAGL